MRIRMRFSTTLHWKSGGRAPARCGACFRGPVLGEGGRRDPAAIAQVRAEAWPDVRDADELHDVLHTLVALPEGLERGSAEEVLVWGRAPSPVQSSAARLGFADSASTSTQGASAPLSRTAEGGRPHMNIAWLTHFERLMNEGRAGIASVADGGTPSGRRRYWVAAERALSFVALFPGAQFVQTLAEVETAQVSREDALLTLVTGWMSHVGPVTASHLGEELGLPTADISNALLRMEASGTILRGRFTDEQAADHSIAPVVAGDSAAQPHQETEWCERRLLARIHRLTVGTLRKQIQPVTAAQFMRWLMRWQHVVPGTQVAGERGTLEVLQQLQGFEIPANAWERQVLARRIADYDPKWLDQLCLTGAVGWGRLSPHPATLDYPTTKGKDDSPETAAPSPRQRRVIPTSVAPITFFVREDADWMIP